MTSLVDKHIDLRLEATKDKFMSYLSASITARIIEQFKSQLPQILSKKVSNFAPPMIKSMVTGSLEHVVLTKESSQQKSIYEAATSLKESELKKFLIDKMDELQSYLTIVEHKKCYDGLIKSYDLDKSLFSTYDKVYSLKRSRKGKDKDKDRFARSDQGLKKRKTRKDAEPTTCPKTKESKSGSSKGGKSQSKSFGKSVQSKEPEFVVVDSDMPQDQEENLGNDDEETKRKSDQRKNFYGYARGLESTHDVYSTKGDDVSDFANALQMFTRSMAIQKRVEDLQLGVKSYQKKINVTKPETPRPDLRKKDPYTPYQYP
nr:hypothetical protein [Tanacetum cinerariifolium]